MLIDVWKQKPRESGYQSELYNKWYCFVASKTDPTRTLFNLLDSIGDLVFEETVDISPSDTYHNMKDMSVVISDIDIQGFHVRTAETDRLLDQARNIVKELVYSGRAVFNKYPASSGDTPKFGLTTHFGGLSFYVIGRDEEETEEVLAQSIRRDAKERAVAEADWRKIFSP